MASGASLATLGDRITPPSSGPTGAEAVGAGAINCAAAEARTLILPSWLPNQVSVPQPQADLERLAALGERTFRDTLAADNSIDDMEAYVHQSFSLDRDRPAAASHSLLESDTCVRHFDLTYSNVLNTGASRHCLAR